MRIIRQPGEMTAWAKEQAGTGKTLCLVPTMGFFHEGHLSLMRLATKQADSVIVSLFVNSIQFGPNEDYEDYPRDFDQDCRLAEQQGVHIVFAPDPADMYPDGFRTSVSVGEITGYLCGANRPGHFDGVATVLTKLFHLTRAEKALFGEKDFQQLAVIRRMVTDLNMDIDILGHPIVRDKDGLALSSRNSYLDDSDRPTALSLFESITITRASVKAGMHNAKELAGQVRGFLESFGKAEIEYVRLIDSRTLESVEIVDEETLLVLAVRINGKVRLIDNGFVLLKGNDGHHTV